MALVVYQGPTESLIDTEHVGVASETGTATKFVGLSNQGATCYLNGLLQTLFMTPEFRKAIFTWNYDPAKDGAEEFCIPLQLQRLFGLLQLSNQRAVDTVALTHSFGWEGSEVFQQQDVQELTRVLFDALEETFRGTAVENIIDELYAGELIDYLRCLDVDYQSERTDKFLDFSLAIVPFGSDKPMRSLTECIEMYLRPEILDGDNKYYAEKFDRKVDAIKGLKFGKLPKIMSVQLKRFVYDFSGPSIVQKKLNDVVKFPMILDMNKYVAKGASSKAAKKGEDGEEEHAMMMRESNEFEAFLVKQMDLLKAGRETSSEETQQPFSSAPAAFAMPALISEPPDWLDDDVPPLACVECAPASASTAASTAGDASKDTAADSEESVVYDSMTSEQLEVLIAQRGEWVYELYAVLIHSGVINGGHYYAYIKDLNTKRWWNFNDSSVTPMDEKAVQEAWGSAYTTSTAFNYPMPLYGRPINVSGRSLSSANAYMLMYRKATEMSSSPAAESSESGSVVVSRPVLSVSPVVTDEMVPRYIRDLVQEELRQAEERRRAQAEERNKLTVKVFWQGTEHTVRTLKNATYKQLLTQLWEQMEVKHHLGENLTRHLQKLSALKATAPAEVEDVVVDVAINEESSMQDDSTPSTTTAAVAECNTVAAPATSRDALSGGPCFDLFRLRNYNAYTHLKSDAYEIQACAELSLDSLNFRDFRTYVLETRSSEDEWEVYYVDGLSLNILEYDATTGAFKEPRTLRMKRSATLGELRQAVSRWVPYSVDRIHIMKIINCGFNDGQLDVLTNDAASLREGLGVYDGAKLYVEEKNPENEAQHKAFDAFLNARNRVDIRVNRPPDESFGLTLTVDLRWTVQQLRTFVAEKLELGTEELRLFKQSTMGVELRDGPNTLAFTGVYNSMGMAVKLGKATPVGYFNVQFVEFVATSNKVGVVELPELEPEYEIVTTAPTVFSAVTLFGREDPLKDSILDDIDDSPPPLVSVPYGSLNSAALAAVAGAAEVSFDPESAIERNSVGSNEGVADYNDIPDLEGDFTPCKAADGTAVAAVEDIMNFANFDDFPVSAVPVVATAEAFPADFSTDPVMPSSQVFPTAALPMESPYAVPADGERLAKSDVMLGSALVGDDMAPSDFGERMVKNCIEVTQFQPIEGFSNLFIQSSSKINDVKAQVVSKLVELGRLPEGTSPHRIRLREKLGNSPGQILSGDDTFSNNQVYLFDNKVLVFQVLEHEEFPPDAERGSVMVLVQRWNRSTWSLGDRFEVLLRSSMTIRNIARSLSFLTGIALHSMLAMVLPRDAEFPLSDIALRSPPQNYGRSWFDPSKERRLLSAMSHELRVTDGDVLLLQDTSERLLELSPADRKSIEIVRVANQQAYWSPSTSSAPLSGNRNPFDSHPASSNTSTKSGLKHGHSSSNGVHIKTHRDRLQEQSDRSLNSTAAACGTDASDVVSTTGSGTLSPVPPLEAVEADYVDNNVDYREFEKLGGVALFADIN